jgi:HTH-type transcriptional regulator / antitoxin HipB
MDIFVRAPEQLGQALRRWRRKKNLTQHEVAEKAGLTQKTVSQIENGSQAAEIKTIFLICSAMNLELTVRERPQMLQSPSKVFGGL